MVVNHLLIAEMLTHESFHPQPFLNVIFSIPKKSDTSTFLSEDYETSLPSPSAPLPSAYQAASLPTWSETTGAMDGVLRLPNTQASEPKKKNDGDEEKRQLS